MRLHQWQSVKVQENYAQWKQLPQLIMSIVHYASMMAEISIMCVVVIVALETLGSSCRQRA